MTTTTHPKLNRIIALRDQARGAGTTEAEREVFMAKAREMCAKYDIDPAILDAKPETQRRREINFGGGVTYTAPAKKYPCRFGCGTYVQHTIDELNACAEKARNANGGNAYAQAKAKPKTDPFDSWFADFARQARNDNAGGTRRDTGEAKARTTGSHAYCSHEATKSARAKCRRERGY